MKRRSAILLALALVAVLAGQEAAPAAKPTARRSAQVGGAVSAKPDADCSSPLSGQVVACAGRFWKDGSPITLHGFRASGISGKEDMDDADYTLIQSWHMNVVRMRLPWAMFEPNPPVFDGTTWIHDYNDGALGRVREQLDFAAAHGIDVILENDCLCSRGYPQWLFEAPYNSHGIDYDPTTEEGRLQFQTDYWTDDLLKQFTQDWLLHLVMAVQDKPGVLGYEPVDEPNPGHLAGNHTTTQLLMDTQLAFAQAIRTIDPNRVILFTTRGANGAGLPLADFSGWQALGNVAFDLHGYYGARWGPGLDLSLPGDTYGEEVERLFNFTLSSLTPPYLGSTDDQARFFQFAQDILAPSGIPLFVGEFGGNSDQDPNDPNLHTDPNIASVFGTMTQALNLQSVSWAALSYDGRYRVFHPDDTLQPWAEILCNAAAYPNVVTDCPETIEGVP
jgi:Cellulase (glycosyl hydrolase family 5)